jgi:hypothetical protein
MHLQIYLVYDKSLYLTPYLSGNKSTGTIQQWKLYIIVMLYISAAPTPIANSLVP